MTTTETRPPPRRRFYSDLLTKLMMSGELDDAERVFLATLTEITIFKKHFDYEAFAQLKVPQGVIGELMTLQQATSLWSTFPKFEEDSVAVVAMVWNDKLGPELREFFPEDLPFSVESVATQMFNAGFWGKETTATRGMLMDLEEINRQVYLLFDVVPNIKMRAKEMPVMIGVIAPKITYAKSLQLKDALQSVVADIKQQRWDIKEWWESVSRILTTRTFHYFSR